MALVDVASPFDGTVALHHLDVGATVEKGEAILEVEAMKTFMRVVAPVAGVVTWMTELGEIVGHDEIVAKIDDGQ